MAIQFILSGGNKCPPNILECQRDRLITTEQLNYNDATKIPIFNTDTKKGIRNPSYCDRILYRLKQLGSSGYNLQQTSYKSFTNDTISKSDHNMVYATYQINKEENELFNILFIIWNQEKLNVVADDVFKGFDDLNKYDIVVISQQESTRNDTLQPSIIDKYIGTHRIFKDSVGSGILIDLITGEFYVRVTVMVKRNSLNISLYHYEKAYSYNCLGSSYYPFNCTKSIIGMGLAIKLDPKHEFSLNVFGCHMPINTSVDDLGYKERVIAYNKMENHMQGFNKLGVDSFVAELDIIGGDMNFRYNSGMEGDQLIKGMESGEVFDSFKEGEITFGPTCKMCICKEVIANPK